MNTIEEIQLLKTNISLHDCQKSFSRLFELFYPRAFEVAKYYLKADHLAEEAVSDVFIKLWNHRARFDEIRDLRSYLLISVKRQSLNALRDQKKNSLFIDSVDRQFLVELENPEQKLIEEELLEYLSVCIQNLPEKCRIVFKMVKEDNLKYKEVAEILNLSLKTVEMHMSAALKRLRADLEKYSKHNRKSLTSLMQTLIMLFPI